MSRNTARLSTLLLAFATPALAPALAPAFAAAPLPYHSEPMAGLSDQDMLDHAIGQAVFERLWVEAPSSTKSADGLGPLYNARSCAACHPGGGRGELPDPAKPGDQGVGVALRLGSTGSVGDPAYGRQLQVQAVTGQSAEGLLSVTSHTVRRVNLPGGTTVRLRRLDVQPVTLAFGPLAPTTHTSVRVAPPVLGAGLLERIPEADILAAADPDDRNGDGISGRPNRDATGALGRFGWKATNATLAAQNAEAAMLDLGLSTALFPAPWGDCTEAQAACRAAPHGNQARFEGVEIPSSMMGVLNRYMGHTQAPGATPPDGPGGRLFAETGCAACHRPAFTTGDDPAGPALSRQAVFPYTDLLLHDLGPELGDGLAAGDAAGSDWRTPPLWGLHRLKAHDGKLALLHDGRARSVAEAILWHGGEADSARTRFAALSKADRDRLIRFVLSL